MENSVENKKYRQEVQSKANQIVWYDSRDLASIAHCIAFIFAMLLVIRFEATRNRGIHLLTNRPKALATFTLQASKEVAIRDVVAIAQQLRLRIESLDLDKSVVILGDDRRAWLDWGWYLAIYIEELQLGFVTVSIGVENKVKRWVRTADIQQKVFDEFRACFRSKSRKVD